MEEKSHLHKTPLHNMVSQLLGPAHKCDTIPGSAEFWDQLTGALLNVLDTTGTDTEDHAVQETRRSICDRLLNFVRILYYPDLELNKKLVKVTFRSEDEVERSFNEIKVEDTGQKAELGKHATGFVHKVVQQTFKRAYRDRSSDSLKLLCEILKLNSCDDIVSKLVQCRDVDPETRENDKNDSDIADELLENENNSSIVDNKVKPEIDVKLAHEHFVFDVCLDWLRQLQKQGRSSTDLNNVMNMISLFMNTMEREKMNQLLEELNEVCFFVVFFFYFT